MQPSDHDPAVGALSDEALLRLTSPLASRVGCKLVAVAAVIALVCALWLGLRDGALALAAGLSTVAGILWLRRRSAAVQQARAAERELERRFGAEPLAQQLQQARAQLATRADLEVLGLFRARVLPHGALRWMRVEIGAEPKLLVCIAPALTELQRGRADRLELVRTELPLTAAQVERSRTLLRELAQQELAPLASFVEDGFACEASVLLRGATELHASANLAGLPDQLRHHPSVRLIELFLDLEAELLPDARLG